MPAKPLNSEQLEEAAKLKKAVESYQEKHPELTQELLAHLCGWKTQGAVSQYLHGKIPLNPRALARFSKAIDIAPEEISPGLAELIVDLEREIFISVPSSGFEKAALPKAAKTKYADPEGEKDFSFRERNVEYGRSKVTHVPVVEWSFPTALGTPASKKLLVESTASVCVSDERVGSTAFALVVHNESMRSRLDPSFEPGDFLVCDPAVQAVAGDFVIAKELGVDAPTFKKLVFDSGRWFLASLNEAFPPMREIDDPKVRVIARVMQRVKISKF